jgi:2,3-bisphosphoglycerate-independent phosphoglycerate mutase
MKNTSPTVLVILDGFGYREEDDHNAVAQASMPTFVKLLSSYPATTLLASGPAVGLPQGYNGNSEVGHLTMGCGKIIKQPFTLIEESIAKKSFYNLAILKKQFQKLKQSGKTLHIMGLLSDGGVHSSLYHLFAFLKMAQQQGLTKVVIHPFLDGRDVDPHSASRYLELLEKKCKKYGIGKIGSIHGRFYAMDRNKNWQQTERTYQVLTEKQPVVVKDWRDCLKDAYQDIPSEEFIQPTQLDSSTIIQKGDGIVFCNFRSDRARQLTSYFVNGSPDGTIKPFDLSFFITPVSYGPQYKTTILFKKTEIPLTLTQFLHDKGHTIFSIAETEKYAHVTYFFNGGREEKLEHETRILVPSITRQNYNDFPNMSADTITDAVVQSLTTNPHDFYVINYANADIVGHTGNFDATLKALECLDKQLKILLEEVVNKQNGILLITGDHGNSEDMFDEANKQPRTSHTANPVFFIMAAQDLKDVHLHLPVSQLSDIAPFVAQIMIDGLQTSLR